MRRFEVWLALVLLAAPAQAGLRFQNAPSPPGADVAALTADGATLWAATGRGVWRLASGAWSLDGLSDQSVVAVAVSDGFLWAATSEKLYRRLANGTYVVEPLPTSNPFPQVLLADGATLYLGGLGVYRRQGGTWSALPSYGSGLVSSAMLFSGDLVVGLNTGGAARFANNVFTPYLAGFGTGEGANALTVLSGTLYAGSGKGLYSWTGAVWVADTAFGFHDVRALSSLGGVLRAGTFDAGVRKKTGGSWTAENTGLLTLAVRAFAVSGSDLFLGTGGGPVSQLYVSSWVEAGAGTLAASVVTDVLTGSRSDRFSGDVLVATQGGGVLLTKAIPPASAASNQVPEGCGNVTALAFSSGGASGDVVAATSCGPLSGPTSWSSLGGGLPANVTLTALATTPDGVEAGTLANGLFRLFGGAWAQDTGLSPTVSVLALRQAGSNLYASLNTALTPGLFARTGSSGAFVNVSLGSPSMTGRGPAAFAGSDPVFAGYLAGGVHRRDGISVWRKDSFGLNASSVFSLDVANGRLVAAAGTSGVFVKREGGFGSENQGLPTGVDARVARSYRYDGTASVPFARGVYVGTAGHGAFMASTSSSVKTLPVVLDVVGATGARFRSELVIGNRAAQALDVTVAFAPAPGFTGGSAQAGSVAQTIAAGAELRLPDALDFLRTKGLVIPPATPSAPIAGSLTVSAKGVATDSLYAIARTYTRNGSGGTFGLFYDAPSDLDAAEDEATVYGLRTISGVSRSNLALVHLPGRGSAPIDLSVQVYGANGSPAGSPLTRTLQPGEWVQFDGILLQAGLPNGSYGYARITRTSGVGAFTAYGVVNDAATSDGSYLPAYRPGGLAAARRLVVPVVLDVYGAASSHYTTEVTLANDGSIATPVDIAYKPAPGFGSAPGVPNVTLTLGARAQTTIPDIVQYLRDRGVQIPDPKTAGPQAGTLTVDFRSLTSLDSPKTIALARTSTPNPDTTVGGSYGLFYAAAARGGGARTAAVVPGLRQDAGARSNLAVVNLGGGSELPIDLSVQLTDAATGAAVGNALTITLQPGDWFQWSNVLDAAGALGATSQAIAVVTRTSGDDTFLAYGVVNDALTSDGSYLKMIPAETY